GASGRPKPRPTPVPGAGLGFHWPPRGCGGAAHDRSLDVTRRQLALTETQVKGLLSLGRVENHPRSPCDIAELLHEVADLLEPTCEHANVQMARCDRGPGPLVADVDVEGLRAAVLNLALNAIEAAGSNGLVGLGARNLGSMVAVEVTDSGPGPQGDLASSLFDPFVTSKPEGVGLGLSLARQVAVDNGGALEWSRHDGRTVFRLTLPAAAQEMHSVRGDRINDAAAFAIDPSHSALTT
ncbi:MAG: sensor histidine kinase, partial [Planctomycetaceae bacterium]